MLAARVRRFVRTLGLSLTVSLSLAMASLVAFSALAEESMEAEFRGFDRAVLVWVGHHVRPAWTPYVLQVSMLGSPLGMSLVSLLFGVALLARQKAWDAATLLAVMLGGGALTMGLKALFKEPRPHVFPPLAHETGYSFPSGHAVLSFCFFGYLAYWIVAQAPRDGWRWILGALSAGMALLIALSRLYLGVHSPTDVTAGMLAAVFWLASCLSIRHWIARTPFDRRA
ncbi:MAG TPA: phosphatase PAP2 family protein [Stenomitos sp.]